MPLLLDPHAFLIDPRVADLQPWQAVTASVALLVSADVLFVIAPGQCELVAAKEPAASPVRAGTSAPARRDVVLDDPGSARSCVLLHRTLYTDHMTIKLTATEAKAKILALLDEVVAGNEIEITRRGRIVARLVPAAGPHALKGTLAGVAMTAGKDDGVFSTGARWRLK